MPGETDVINFALRKVGANPIVSIADGTPSANSVNDMYSEIRDQLLRSHPWNFATKRVQLAESATDPTFEFDYAFALPADWLRTISLHDNDAGHGSVLYRTELVDDQRVIVTSSSQAWLRYVASITDPNLMTPDFRMLLAVSLARDLAIPLASSNTLYEQLARQADRLMGQARSTDALDGFPEMRPRGSWASSRGGWRRDDFLSD